MQKGETFSPAYFLVLLCHSRPLPPFSAANPAPSWRYQNMPTDNWEVPHLVFSFLPLQLQCFFTIPIYRCPLSFSPSLSVCPALYSLLAIKHWAAINKLANHFQPSPRAPRCHRDSYRLLLFAFVFASFFVVSPPPSFSLLVGVEWMLMSVVIGNWYFTKHLSFQVISESLKNKTWSGNKYVMRDNAWYTRD